MRIAVLSSPGRGRTDLLIAEAVARLEMAGVVLAGTVATRLGDLAQDDCGMVLRILPEGRVLTVSQVLGPGARGCRLDPGGVETAAALATAALPRVAGLVVNKFGKLEAMGRGFVPVIGAALDLGLPVLVGVNGLNLPDFRRFAGGLATELPASARVAADWMRASLRLAA